MPLLVSRVIHLANNLLLFVVAIVAGQDLAAGLDRSDGESAYQFVDAGKVRKVSLHEAQRLQVVKVTSEGEEVIDVACDNGTPDPSTRPSRAAAPRRP